MCVAIGNRLHLYSRVLDPQDSARTRLPPPCPHLIWAKPRPINSSVPRYLILMSNKGVTVVISAHWWRVFGWNFSLILIFLLSNLLMPRNPMYNPSEVYTYLCKILGLRAAYLYIFCHGIISSLFSLCCLVAVAGRLGVWECYVGGEKRGGARGRSQFPAPGCGGSSGVPGLVDLPPTSSQEGEVPHPEITHSKISCSLTRFFFYRHTQQSLPSFILFITALSVYAQ